MMVGHALLAFALVAAVTARFWPARRAVRAGVIAGAFATVPDADMVYALVGLATADYSSIFTVTSSFWSASTAVHRTVTHSLVVALPAAVAFAAWYGDDRPGRWVALAVGVGLIGLVTAVSGVLGAVVATAFVLAGCVVATLARGADFDRTTVFVLALFGLVSHPWGDVFTGTPPAVLYPLPVSLFDGRVALASDPTLHLLGAFGVEMAVVWFAVAVLFRLADHRIGRVLGPDAGLGSAYGAAALVLAPPTLAMSYHFVFSILGVGLLVAGLRLVRAGRSPDRLPISRLDGTGTVPDGVVPSLVTGLAAVTVAWTAYLLAYLWLL